MHFVVKLRTLHYVLILQCQIENGGFGNLFQCTHVNAHFYHLRERRHVYHGIKHLLLYLI